MMLMDRAHVSILLILLMGMKVYGQGCPMGWFGAGCRLECHCEQSQHCGVGGECPDNEPCRSPYFGTGCQYVDLIITHGAGDIPEYISDGNDSSCNPDTNATSVQLKFIQSVWLVWYRIRTNNNITLFHRNFTTKAGAVPCLRVYLYRVDNTAMDVRCDSRAAVTAITIEGLVVPYICTIHVSGGRNIALHQNVRQTSNYSGDPWSKVRAENAVDGNINPNYASGSCSRTNAEITLPNWLLRFDSPKWINRIVIYNTNVNKDWLCKFEMATFDSGGKANWYHKDNSPQALSVYAVLLNSGKTVKGLRIQAARLSQTRITLSLCEVQVFGETNNTANCTHAVNGSNSVHVYSLASREPLNECDCRLMCEAVCSSDQHGLDCEHRCQCTTGVNCSITTGACEYTPVYYCYPGTYGEMCQFPCHEHCSFNVCDAHTAACLHCVPGYMGEFCDEVCTPGTFGINCSLECWENCAEPCHHITGVCSCVEGFTGDLCSECADGWYGDNCTYKCSNLCYMSMCDLLTGECETCIENHIGLFCDECDIGWFGDNCTQTCPKICPGHMCDNITGECVSCVGNRIGRKCEDCPEGYYGTLCDIRCSAYCRNRSCEEVGGSCYACVDGYQGEYCNLEMEDTLPSFWILPLIVPFPVLLLACFLMGGGHTQEEDE